MKKVSNSDVAVIIPTLNEEENIGEVIRKLNQMGYHNVLVVDGNSNDRTLDIAKEFGANVVVQSGKGKGVALRQAFDYGNLNGEVVVVMDADGSMNPKEIPLFIKALASGADLVKGSRFLPNGYSEDMTLIRKFGDRFIVLLVNLFWSANYTDSSYGFWAFRKDAIEKLCPYLKSTNFEIETEILIKAKKLGLKAVEIPSVEFRRRHGKSNLCIFGYGFRVLKMIIEELVNGPTIKGHPK